MKISYAPVVWGIGSANRNLNRGGAANDTPGPQELKLNRRSLLGPFLELDARPWKQRMKHLAGCRPRCIRRATAHPVLFSIAGNAATTRLEHGLAEDNCTCLARCKALVPEKTTAREISHLFFQRAQENTTATSLTLRNNASHAQATVYFHAKHVSEHDKSGQYFYAFSKIGLFLFPADKPNNPLREKLNKSHGVLSLLFLFFFLHFSRKVQQTAPHGAETTPSAEIRDVLCLTTQPATTRASRRRVAIEPPVLACKSRTKVPQQGTHRFRQRGGGGTRTGGEEDKTIHRETEHAPGFVCGFNGGGKGENERRAAGWEEMSTLSALRPLSTRRKAVSNSYESNLEHRGETDLRL